MIGSVISHYKILEKLGEGGMGVVYKAQDTKLNRSVAIKFLPDRVNRDEAAKARFLQEAQAAAGLNHPNICTVYGVEEVDGSLFMVMELIEGGTLRDKIPFGKQEDAVTIATQIGEALGEAHAKGIVHRDVKAENIMLTAKGQAKVMDFGLAKLKGAMKLTRTSSTVGTLGYMAPEQIQGGEVDHRSDIFSFGVLLFEMLTGKLPFRGEHEAAMVYSIVNEEPQDITSSLPNLSSVVVNLIQRCLEKDPADRYQTMQDIVSDLHRSQKKTSRVTRSSSYVPVQSQLSLNPAGSAPTSSLDSTPSRKPLLARSEVRFAAAGAVVGLVLLAWLLFWPAGIRVNPDMTTRRLEIPFTQFSYAGLSPDGKWIAFPAGDAAGKWDVYFMNVDGGEARKITSDAAQFYQQTADVSPNGSEIVYDRLGDNLNSNDIYIISALGGASRKIVTGGASPSWRPDGRRIGFMRINNARFASESGFMEFWTVSVDGSDLRLEYADSLFNNKGGDYRYDYSWSPDGNSIAWIRTLTRDQQVLIIRDLASGRERQLTDRKENIDDVGWTKDNTIIFSSNRSGNSNLWAMPVSGGEAVQVTKGAGPDIALSIAASGNKLVYLQQQLVSHVWIANTDGSGQRQLTFDDRQIDYARFSVDGKLIAFVMRDSDPLSSSRDLYVMDHDGKNRRRLTNGMLSVFFPLWSPDGKQVAFSQFPTRVGADTGAVRLYIVNVDNSGAPTRIGDGFAQQWIDDDHIATNNPFVFGSSSVTTVSTRNTRPIEFDSCYIRFIGADGSVGMVLSRRGEVGYWRATLDPQTVADLTKKSDTPIQVRFKDQPKLLFPFSGRSRILQATSSVSRSGEFAYVGSDGMHWMSFTKGTHRVTPPGVFSTGLRGAAMGMSNNGKEIVFVEDLVNSKLVLLDNAFK